MSFVQANPASCRFVSFAQFCDRPHSTAVRRTLLVVGFLLACALLALMLVLRGAPVSPRSFSDCKAAGNPVSSGSVLTCVYRDGTVVRADDRVVFSDSRLPFSFSYAGSLRREQSHWPLALSLRGSGSVLSVELLSSSEDPASLVRSQPGFSTGSLTIVHAQVDRRDVVVATVRGAHRSIALLPLQPAVGSFGHAYNAAAISGSGALVQQAVASLAFSNDKIPAPKFFLP